MKPVPASASHKHARGFYLGYSDRISSAERWFEQFRANAKAATKRYLEGERSGSELHKGGSRFHLFWANVQTLQPSLYSRTPKVWVERRKKDKDPIGRVASELLERAGETAIQRQAFDDVMRQVRDDYLIVGRGTVWCRYESRQETRKERIPLVETPEGILLFPDNTEVTEDAFPGVQTDDQGIYLEGEEYEEVVDERAVPDYVHYLDFLHNPCRNWGEVTWVARRTYLDREEADARFGSKAKQLEFSLPESLKDDVGASALEDEKRLAVWEIWDKKKRKVCWVAKGGEDKLLDEQEPHLELEHFFPCPKPLFSTTSSEKLIPVPDLFYYSDLLDTLDTITARRSLLIGALRLSGATDASISESMQNILSPKNENKLYPIEDWAAIAGQGGLNSAVDWVDLTPVVSALAELSNQEAQVKQQVYELTGWSDIMRGTTDAQETATAQQLKGQFGTLRLVDRQQEIQRFARDTIAILCEIVCEQFDPKTIAEMASVEEMPDAEAAQNFEAGIALLKNEKTRGFRIQVETDSTINLDESMEKGARTEFVTALTNFLPVMGQTSMQMPTFAPVLGEVLMFAARAYKAGRSLESTLQAAIDNMNQMAEAAKDQPPPPSPEMQKMQAELQMDQQKQASELQLKQFELDAMIANRREEMLGKLENERVKIAGQLQIQATMDPDLNGKGDLQGLVGRDLTPGEEVVVRKPKPKRVRVKKVLNADGSYFHEVQAD